MKENCGQQESIPVGCMLPTCQLIVLQWRSLEVSTCGESCPWGLTNKFKQVFNDGHQTSLARGVRARGSTHPISIGRAIRVPCSHVWGLRGCSQGVGPVLGRTCTVRSNALWVMDQCSRPPDGMMHRNDLKHYLPATSLSKQ